MRPPPIRLRARRREGAFSVFSRFKWCKYDTIYLFLVSFLLTKCYIMVYFCIQRRHFMTKKVKVGYMVDEDIVSSFEVRSDKTGISGARFVQGCMKAYAEGKFKMLDGEPYFDGQGSVPRETSTVAVPSKPVALEPPKKVGRPKEVKEAFNPWALLLDRAKCLWDFKMYAEPFRGDERPHLNFETIGRISKEPFEKLLIDELYAVYEEFPTVRDWHVRRAEFLSCCAMKFFALNEESGIRYDEDSLLPEFCALEEQHTSMIEEGKQMRLAREAEGTL